MKSLFYIAFFLVTSFFQTLNPVNEAGKMTIKFNNVNIENKGTIYFAIYTEGNFMTQNYFKSEMIKVEEGADFTVSFDDVPYGTYAVSAYHDINGNQQMDFNESGMPTEDYAMSGTPNPMGPPNWEEVKFEFKKETELVNVNF